MIEQLFDFEVIFRTGYYRSDFPQSERNREICPAANFRTGSLPRTGEIICTQLAEGLPTKYVISEVSYRYNTNIQQKAGTQVESPLLIADATDRNPGNLKSFEFKK